MYVFCRLSPATMLLVISAILSHVSGQNESNYLNTNTITERSEIAEHNNNTVKVDYDVPETTNENSGTGSPSDKPVALKSRNNAYIVLIGMTGAGKSSTLNFLFGNRKIAPVNFRIGAAGSNTIEEYVVEPPGISGSRLYIIDTPGIGPPKGLDENAQVLRNLNNFLSNHHELSQLVPNVVLVFSRFDDNRIEGHSSSFVSMLKSYELISTPFFSDVRNTSNVVFVLTRFLSELSSITRKPATRLADFQSTVETYTTKYPKPVVFTVADNEAPDEELQQDDDGNYRLPNKEYYPKNLIAKMILSCNQSGDSVGESILKAVFSQRITIHVKINVPPDTGAVSSENGTLSRESENDFYQAVLDIETTEVSMSLAQAYEKIPETLQQSYAGVLQSMQLNFQRRGIKFKDQIPKGGVEVMKFLQGMDMNSAMVRIFEIAFYVEIPKFSFELLTGQGYDIFKGQPLKSPLNLEALKFSPIGFMIPRATTLHSANSPAEGTILNFYGDIETYRSSRLRKIGLEQRFNSTLLRFEASPGENIESSWTDRDVEIVGVREYPIFELELNNANSLNFTEEFLESLKYIPDFDLSNPVSVQEWKNLFEEFGAYVVRSANGGGQITTILNVRGEELRKLRRGSKDSVHRIFDSLPFNNGYTQKLNRKEFKSAGLEFEFGGGSWYCQTDDEPKAFDEQELEEAQRCVEEWKESLTFRPIMFSSKINLIPLSDLVKSFNRTLAEDMRIAEQAFLEGHLEPVPDATTNTTLSESLGTTSKPSFTEHIVDNSNIDELKKLQKSINSIMDAQRRAMDSILNQTKRNNEELESVTVRSTTPRLYHTPSTKAPNESNTKRYNWKIETTTTTATTTTRPYRTPDGTYVQPTYTYTSGYPQHDISQTVRCNNVEQCSKQTGYSYDITIDQVLFTTPFDSSADASCKLITPVEQPDPSLSVYTYKKFPTHQEYRKFRQVQINSDVDVLKIPQIFWNPLPGHNVGESRLLSILIQHKTYKTQLRRDCQSFNEQFRRLIKELPYYRRDSCYAVSKWREFFYEYGTHVVESSHLGGSIVVGPQDGLMDLIKHYDSAILQESQWKDTFDNMQWDQMNFTFNVRGGNKFIFGANSHFTKSNMAAWSNSLHANPHPLLTNIKIKPHSAQYGIDWINHEFKNSYYLAREDYISGGIKRICGYKPFNGCTIKIPASKRAVTVYKNNCFIQPYKSCKVSTFRAYPGHRFHFCGIHSKCDKRSWLDGYTCLCEAGYTVRWIADDGKYECALERLNQPA